MPTVAIVVPVLDAAPPAGAQGLASLLDAIAAQDRPPEELILAVGRNAHEAHHRLVAFAAARPSVQTLCLDNPSGAVSAALNLGIAAAHSEVIIRLDAHSRPYPDYVRQCLSALDESGAALVGGHIEVAPGKDGAIGEAIAVAVGHPLGAGDARYRLQSPSSPGDVDTVPYGCYRKSLWQQLGGFDEGLPANEDYDFNYRVRAAGGRVHFNPAIRIGYRARGTFAELARQYFRYGWWKQAMLSRHPRSVRWRQWLPVAALAWLAALLVAAPFGEGARAALTISVWAYALLLVGAGVGQALRRKRAALAWALPVAFAIIHFAWSGGMWAHWLSALATRMRGVGRGQ